MSGVTDPAESVVDVPVATTGDPLLSVAIPPENSPTSARPAAVNAVASVTVTVVPTPDVVASDL